MKTTLASFLGLGMILTLGSAALALPGDPLSPAGWTAAADSWYPHNDPGQRMPIHAFDGSGLNVGADLTLGTTDDTHTGLGLSNPNSDIAWMTQSSVGSSQNWTAGQRWLRVDMQSDKTIGKIQIWNYFEGNGDRGSKDVEIWYQTSTGTGALPIGHVDDGNGADFVSTNWTSLGSFTLTKTTTNPTLITDTLDPVDFVARHILIDIKNNYGANINTNETGISEIRFLEGALAAESVPEPSTFILAALGLAGLGLFARRKSRKISAA